MSEPGRMVVAAAFHDPLALLAQRSPGSRAPGALTQTKHPRKKRAAPHRKGGGAGAPKQRVLANVRSRPPAESGVGAPIADLIGPGSALALPDLLNFGNDDLPGASGSSAGVGGSGPGGGYGVSPGVGGGGGGGVVSPGVVGSSPSPVAEPPAVSSAPEPSTWLMMVIGFGGIGLTLRVRRAAPTKAGLPVARA